MSFNISPTIIRCLATTLLLSAIGQTEATDLSSTPLSTYAVTSANDVKPNVLFLLDDSGSMSWDFMPDWACASQSTTNSSCGSTGQDPSSTRYEYMFRNAAYNGVYYNPAVRYVPPIAVGSTGATNSTTYLNMTGVSTSTGADSNGSTSNPNWNAVKNDAYGVQSTSTSNITPTSTSQRYFFTTIAGEYCDSSSLKNCTTSSTPTGTYTFPAPVRWCDSNGANCQAAFSSTHAYVRAPAPRTSTIAINSVASGTTVSSISFVVGSNTYQILNSTVTSTGTNTSTFAAQIAAAINACNGSLPSSTACNVSGFAATVSSNVITITAGPVATSSLSTSLGTPTISNSGTFTSTQTAFTTTTVPGFTIMTVIVPSTTALYPYPGGTVKYATRSDCAASTCTGNEEMTNYANWWTYYRTRMQMMKTAASNAFASIDTNSDIAAGKSRYRVGYMTINNNANTDFVNLGEFTGTQKFTWYSQLLKAKPSNSTPLRARLSDAGRLYGGKLNGTTYNGVVVSDPLQYYCQRNYTILSTDGFWNGGAGYKLDGSTAVGNQDIGLPAPYGDGGTSTLQARTSKLQVSTAPLINQYRNTYLQTRSQVFATAPSILKRTSTNSGGSWTAWGNASSCVSVGTGSNRTQCQFPYSNSTDSGATWTAWAYYAVDAQCTPDTTGRTRTACSGTVFTGYTAWVNATGTCTVGGTTECRYYQPTTSFTNTTNNAACTPVTASPSSPYTVLVATECQQVIGSFSAYVDATATCTTSSTTRCQYTSWSSWGNVSSCTNASQSANSPYTQLLATQCQTVIANGTSDTLADVAQYYYSTDLRTATPNSTADTTGTCTSSTGYDLCNNSVPKGGDRDTATWQHMTTFTLGLGSQGQMIYAPTNSQTNDYWSDTSGDFKSILIGATANTSTGVCSWQSSGQCYWPIPSADSNANIDDLWHAAVNGRGTYFSAKDPTSLSTGLATTLGNIPAQPRDGTSAAAASSNPNVTTTDNFVFSSSYKSMLWTGELTRKVIASDGSLSSPNWYASRLLDCSTTVWTAQTTYYTNSAFRYTDSSGTKCYYVKSSVVSYTSGDSFDANSNETNNTLVVNVDEAATSLIPATPNTSRTIKTNISGTLVDFVDSNASLLSTFSTSNWKPYLSQFCSTGTGCVSNPSGATAQMLINYIRGDRTNEGTYYRSRVNILGDIVSSEARYVKVPLQNYTDTSFNVFKTAMASRTGMVYVGANDGMLHAFNATTGKEAWAYIPSRVVPNLYKLADMTYSNNHQYFVDGTPTISDVYGPCRSGVTGCIDNEWRTILIGGLNGGGKGYYALDVTDPANPIFLWEFTDTNMGYTYGNPKITKLKNGKWVVLLSSGYNTADGKSHLYIRNVIDGTTTGLGASQIDTGVTGEMGRIDSRALYPDTDNTSVAAYGGDTAGNLWRFDINGDIGASGYDAQKLVSFKDANGKAQPITAKPDMATVNGKTMVYVGTGRYLGISDITNTDYQTFYGVVDRSDTNTLTSPRDTGSKFVRQVLTAGLCPANTPASICVPNDQVKTSTSNTVDWATNDGWYVDFLTAGERSATDATLVLGTVLFTTITPTLPSADPCLNSTAGGDSYLYALNYVNGGAVNGSNGVVGTNLGAIIATRPVPIELQNGSIVAITQGTAALGSPVSTITSKPPIYLSGAGVRRVSWRELTSQ
ncbi:PilC/PilY family type IV pilus protein [Rhodoferax sp. GW822-FHT02A01]|uniref:pilus assembly protein n=1 Tax=Rhodoferax sp. GW822-FHT02A01 TaxID=3141537 RepID=UPI00315D5EC3